MNCELKQYSFSTLLRLYHKNFNIRNYVVRDCGSKRVLSLHHLNFDAFYAIYYYQLLMRDTAILVVASC